MTASLELKKLANIPLRLGCFHANHVLKKYHPKLWVIGDGRSGTTWVTSLINTHKHYREMFEPFHPDYIREMEFLRSDDHLKPRSHFYARPDEDDQDLQNATKLVFEGKLWHQRIDADNRAGLFTGLLVKDIFANLFSKWVHNRFPDITILLLIRNPFAVALSKHAKKDWEWVTDPMTLYNQPNLRADYLCHHEDLIRRVSSEGDYILKQILIWSMIHYVPFKQFSTKQIHVVFYENVVVNPNLEISKILHDKTIELPESLIKQPSKMVGKNIKQGKSPIDSWLSDLQPRTIDAGMEILESFGLEKIYGSDAFPNTFDIDEY